MSDRHVAVVIRDMIVSAVKTDSGFSADTFFCKPVLRLCARYERTYGCQCGIGQRF